jgi:uncharacterized protein
VEKDAGEGIPGPGASAKEVYEFTQRLLEGGDSRAWCDMFADDGIFEIVLAPPGFPNRMEGPEQIYRTMLPAQELARGFENTRVYQRLYETTDPAVVVCEFAVDRKDVTTGTVYRMPYVHVVTIRGGKYVHFRDYTSFQLGPPMPAELAERMNRSTEDQ